MNAIVPIGDMERMAIAVSKSNLFGCKTPDQAMALMLLAQAEGVHPAKAIQDYHIIDGKPALRADAMLARFQASGGRVEWTEYTDQRVCGTFSHPQGGTISVDWDQARAKAAGLLNRKNWQSYPRQMLRARVISEGVRTVYPGASSGIYTAEEVQDMVEVTPKPADVVIEPAAPSTLLDESERADHLTAISEAADLAELRRAFSTAYGAAKMAGDVDALNDFERAKDARKVALQEAA
jgi:hypothetical protein